MRLKELRRNRKLKQIHIAEILNCSQGVYSRYENEEREPPFDIIKKLADFYGVTVDYLMGRDDQLTPEEQKEAPADDRAEAKQLLEGMTEEQYQAALQYLKFLQSQK
jgi:transcriptional regulator with XRE-family HTH domain